MSATPIIKCESCNGPCKRLIGKGAGIIFKGSGFYETDFKDKKGKPPAKDKKTAAKTGSKTEPTKAKTKETKKAV